jgi:LysM repeat protein
MNMKNCACMLACLLPSTWLFALDTRSAAHYPVKAGDTLESVARLFYGTGGEKYAVLIKEASGLKSGSILSGQTLVIPWLELNRDEVAFLNGEQPKGGTGKKTKKAAISAPPQTV